MNEEPFRSVLYYFFLAEAIPLPKRKGVKPNTLTHHVLKDDLITIEQIVNEGS